MTKGKLHPRVIAYFMRKRSYSVDLFCPAEFHHYSGYDVCLSFCRKTFCSVFRMLVGMKDGKHSSKMRSKAVLPKLKWENPHLVAHNFDALKTANSVMPDWMIREFLRIVSSEEKIESGMHA